MLIAALAVSAVLSACATTSTATSAPGGAASSDAVSAASGGAQRDLTPEEKKIVVDAVAPSLRNPAAAKYRWTKFPAVVTENSVNYCGTVDAQSPYAAYSGRQAYIIEAKVAGGHVTSAVMGLITGGKDFALVTKLCAKYGLDPNKAS
jgi:hypothetical protein